MNYFDNNNQITNKIPKELQRASEYFNILNTGLYEIEEFSYVDFPVTYIKSFPRKYNKTLEDYFMISKKVKHNIEQYLKSLYLNEIHCTIKSNLDYSIVGRLYRCIESLKPFLTASLRIPAFQYTNHKGKIKNMNIDQFRKMFKIVIFVTNDIYELKEKYGVNVMYRYDGKFKLSTNGEIFFKKFDSYYVGFAFVKNKNTKITPKINISIMRQRRIGRQRQPKYILNFEEFKVVHRTLINGQYEYETLA